MPPGLLTNAELDALTEDERDELLALQEDVAGGEGLRDFMTRLAPHHPPPKHLTPVIDALEEARVERLGKWAISMPPGHAKTHLFLNAFAWWLTKFPADTCGYSSYNAPQAHGKSVQARILAGLAGVELSDVQNNKGEWRTTAGGGLVAGGESGFTGKRIQGPLVYDDPFAGPLDAYSPAKRDDAWEWLNTVALPRRVGAPIFVVQTRWHEDDVIGRLAKKGGWRIINLPAISDAGEALWPEQYPLADLLALKQDIGEFEFASLYQGNPRPRGGAVFGEPHYYDPKTLVLEGCRIVLAGDPAASEKTSADYSTIIALAVRGRGPDAVAYVLEVYRQQVTIPQYVSDLVAWQARYGGATINIESVGGFKAIPQMLRAIRPDIRLFEIIPVGDKFTRAQPAAAAWNTSRILVPAVTAKEAPWLGPFLDEVRSFTGVNDRHDDQVDGLAHGWNNAQGPVSMFEAMAGVRSLNPRRVI